MSSQPTRNSSSAKEFLIRSCKLIFFLVGLPAALTAANLSFTLQRQGILLVEPVLFSSSSTPLRAVQSIAGIYWSLADPPSVINPGASYSRDGRLFTKHKWPGRSWPSISQVASSLVKPQTNNNSSGKLEYWNKYQSYCFKNSEYMVCSNSKNEDGFYPPELDSWAVVKTMGGTKVEEDTQTQTIHLRIRTFQWFKPHYLLKQEKPFQQLVQRPATCLLLALNIGLAFVYWNHRVNPNQVALMDGPILQQFQYWRAITGTLAHFEWWHLLFNMMSLHNLGQFLEEHYCGSINFLLYNLALIPLTVLIFLGGMQLVHIARIRIQIPDNNNNAATAVRPSVNAVGYSGVLFAWMVVASLEQTRSCPIPFLSNMCFETWHITKNIKFNVGPLIQLVIAQFILPRVSFGGHLAGIVAGFLLHWNMIPLELVQPSVLIPLLTMVQWKQRHFIPINGTLSKGHELGSPRNFLDEAGIDDEEMNGTEQPKVTGRQIACLCGNANGIFGMAQLLWTIQYAMLLLFFAGFFMMSWSSSLMYAEGILVALLHSCYQAYINHWDDHGKQDQWSPSALQKKQRMLVMWKGFIVSCVLVLVLESMTMASWHLLGLSMFAHAGWGLCLLLAWIIVHLIALSVACQHWQQIGGEEEEKGIFEYSLSFAVLDNAKVVGHDILSFWTLSGGCQRLNRHATLPASTSTSLGAIGGADRSKLAAAAERRARAAQV